MRTNDCLFSCKEDIENADRVFGLLQDLENIRADRLRIGMRTVAAASFGGKKVDLIRVSVLSTTFYLVDDYLCTGYISM